MCGALHALVKESTQHRKRLPGTRLVQCEVQDTDVTANCERQLLPPLRTCCFGAELQSVMAQTPQPFYY